MINMMMMMMMMMINMASNVDNLRFEQVIAYSFRNALQEIRFSMQA
jgi:hypothetical protein